MTGSIRKTRLDSLLMDAAMTCEFTTREALPWAPRACFARQLHRRFRGQEEAQVVVENEDNLDYPSTGPAGVLSAPWLALPSSYTGRWDLLKSGCRPGKRGLGALPLGPLLSCRQFLTQVAIQDAPHPPPHFLCDLEQIPFSGALISNGTNPALNSEDQAAVAQRDPSKLFKRFCGACGVP